MQSVQGRGADNQRWATWAMSLTGLAFVCAVYLPDLGRGFIKDDFSWLLQSRDAFSHLRSILIPGSPGFYRPVVSLSFATDFLLHGLSSRGYGFTNFALFVSCIVALVSLCRVARLSWHASALAAFVWALNPHGINMAVLWISGRTELCVTLFAILATVTFLERRYLLAGFCLAAALGSKEEAVLLPLIMWAWHRLLTVRDNRDRTDYPTENKTDKRWAALAAVGIPPAVYFAVRARTLASTIASAPPFYRFTFVPLVVLRNALEYLDRGATAALIVLLLALLLYRVVPVPRRRERDLLAACAIWFGAGFAITTFLPVRSSLYSVLPSVGSSIACAVLVERARELASMARRPRMPLEALLATALLFIPVQRSRDARWAEPARLSQRAMRAISGHFSSHFETESRSRLIVLQDIPDPLSSFAAAFGDAGADALYLWTGHSFAVSIRPVAREPEQDQELAQPLPVAATFRVSGGRVELVAASSTPTGTRKEDPAAECGAQAARVASHGVWNGSPQKPSREEPLRWLGHYSRKYDQCYVLIDHVIPVQNGVSAVVSDLWDAFDATVLAQSTEDRRTHVRRSFCQVTLDDDPFTSCMVARYFIDEHMSH